MAEEQITELKSELRKIRDMLLHRIKAMESLSKESLQAVNAIWKFLNQDVNQNDSENLQALLNSLGELILAISPLISSSIRQLSVKLFEIDECFAEEKLTVQLELLDLNAATKAWSKNDIVKVKLEKYFLSVPAFAKKIKNYTVPLIKILDVSGNLGIKLLHVQDGLKELSHVDDMNLTPRLENAGAAMNCLKRECDNRAEQEAGQKNDKNGSLEVKPK